MSSCKPEILAPAGGKETYLAAVSAGADSIYCGLKHFSARMQAQNFSIPELAALARLGREHGCKTYIAFNSMIKPQEVDQAARLLDRVTNLIQPEAIIIQDLALLNLARQLGYEGHIHVSTLAAMSSAQALPLVQSMGFQRVVLPRELSIDEIKSMAKACPPDLELETFVHGALCYAVSGRCYWSSYLGGKSGLRGRCVQPCRRLYTHQGKTKRYFSCQDLSLDVLTKTLLETPQIRSWKIEGRKKGPHYVFYTVKAYQMLRDHPQDAQARKTAQEFLERCLGRPTTHYRFLPQRSFCAVNPEQGSGSGLIIGKVIKSAANGPAQFKTREHLLAGDMLRIGSEDLPGHTTYKIMAYTSKGKGITLPRKTRDIAPGSPVALIDRREPELTNRLRRLQNALNKIPQPQALSSDVVPRVPSPFKPDKHREHIHVRPVLPPGKTAGSPGVWLSPSLKIPASKTMYSRIWFWLPPVIWPDDEQRWSRLVHHLIRDGARRFCCNAPWQRALFPDREDLILWAGPYCNLANALALEECKRIGFSGAVVSPELEAQDMLDLPGLSPLPLGVVLSGPWPLCISRTLNQDIKPGMMIQSPKKEPSYVHIKGPNVYHFPNWELDLTEHKPELEKAGYRSFVSLHEKRPKKVPAPQRVSQFNWDLKLV